MATQPVVVGSSYDWFLTAYVNTEAAPEVFGIWDLTGASVSIAFADPNNETLYSFGAAIVSATSGQARFTNSTGLFNKDGEWGVSWTVSSGGAKVESGRMSFQVYKSGAAS